MPQGSTIKRPGGSPYSRRSRKRRKPTRRHRLLTHTVAPLLVVAVAAYLVGSYLAGGSGRSERTLVARYLTAWEHGDYGEMYAMLSSSSKRALSETAFGNDYANVEDTATSQALAPGFQITIDGSLALVRVKVSTRVFGQLTGILRVPLSADGEHLTFEPEMLFPGLRPGETLTRRATLGTRGTLLAANGQILAQGPDLSSQLPTVSNAIVGSLGPIPADERAYYTSLGYPPDAQIGQDGLELIFERQLAGTPGGVLLAGSRVLATTPPKPGRTVKTTIDPGLEEAALSAIGSSYAGMTVLNPKTGGVEAAAGIAFTDVQPPGSTFKIITATAALASGKATIDTEYPETSTTDLDGYTMQNAGGETCGGTLIDAFAQSCDTTFAPLGAALGGKLLVSTAEKFGFNQPTGIDSALESTIPSAADIGDALAVGSSAIGQGDDLASTLEIADVGATIADHGRRPIPTLDAGTRPKFVHVTSAKVASEVNKMMEAVVEYGTGTTAQISGVEVAGKTGTAELANTSDQQNDAKETDAWFVGYAPANDPKVVVCALFPNQGYGADTAAPAVRAVIEAALGIS